MEYFLHAIKYEAQSDKAKESIRWGEGEGGGGGGRGGEVREIREIGEAEELEVDARTQGEVHHLPGEGGEAEGVYQGKVSRKGKEGVGPWLVGHTAK